MCSEDEMVGWHHRLNEHEFEQAPRMGDAGKPGVLQSTGLQRVEHDWVTELNWCMHARSLQSCLSLCNPADCSPPGSSVHWILQARILEWVAISFSGGSSSIERSNPHLLHQQADSLPLSHLGRDAYWSIYERTEILSDICLKIIPWWGKVFEN